MADDLITIARFRVLPEAEAARAMPALRRYVKPSTAIKWIYIILGAALVLYIWRSWPNLWKKV